MKIKTKEQESAYRITGMTLPEIFEECINHDFQLMERCGLRDWAETPTMSGMASFHGCYHTVRCAVRSASARELTNAADGAESQVDRDSV